jgi:hypothetical protein
MVQICQKDAVNYYWLSVNSQDLQQSHIMREGSGRCTTSHARSVAVGVHDVAVGGEAGCTKIL